MPYPDQPPPRPASKVSLENLRAGLSVRTWATWPKYRANRPKLGAEEPSACVKCEEAWLHISSTRMACSGQAARHASHFVQSPGLATRTPSESKSNTSSGHILKHSPWFLHLLRSIFGKYMPKSHLNAKKWSRFQVSVEQKPAR